MTDVETIRQSVVIHATPEEVYDAYVDPKKHAEFTATPVTGVPKVGGRFTAGDGYISGRFIVLERGKKVVQEWKTTEWPAGSPPSRLELTLTPKDARSTVLTMVHSDIPTGQGDYYSKGWKDYYWGPMKEYFRGKKKRRR